MPVFHTLVRLMVVDIGVGDGNNLKIIGNSQMHGLNERLYETKHFKLVQLPVYIHGLLLYQHEKKKM